MTATAKQPKVHIDDLHFDHQRWISELNFYKEELPIYQKRLEEIGQRYTSTEVLKELDHFQNQIYIQGNASDELLHDIKLHEQELGKYAKDHPVAIDHVLFNDHQPLRNRVETHRQIQAELKQEFHRYLAKWM